MTGLKEILMTKMSARTALVYIAALAFLLTGCSSPKPVEPPKVAKDYGLAAALWTACRECNVESVRKLLDAGANLNAPVGPNRTTALMETVRSYDNKCPAEMVIMLVEAGAEINKQDINGYTALHHAAEFNCGTVHVEAAKALLENGADPGILNHANKTPLQLATEVNCAQKMSVLVEYIKSYQRKLDEVIPDPTKQMIPAKKAN
jgi:ankyrin repeat protein